MSQTNVDFSDNPTGAELMDDYLAREQENNLTTNSGIQRPSYAKAGTIWLDTSSEPWTLKMYTGSGDIIIGYVDKTKGTFQTTGDIDVVHKTGNEDIDGIKSFKQGIKGTFQNYYAHNTSDNTKPYCKVMEITLTGSYQTVTIPFIMTSITPGSRGSVLGQIRLRVEGTAGIINTNSTDVNFSFLPDWATNHYDFKILYKNNYPNSNQVLVEFWVKVANTYNGVCFTILDEMAGGNIKVDRRIITWYNNTQKYAELPSDYSVINFMYEALYAATPSLDSNNRQVSTTEWVRSAISTYAPMPTITYWE